jgi:predicted O-methyltransferase YrrM
MKGRSHAELRWRLLLMRWLNPVAEKVSDNAFPSARLHGRELIFQGIVHRELDRLGIDRPFYPVRSAATYSYLYLILRLCTELPVSRVLELGCGQSTLLLDSLARRGGLDVVSLEHDADWAARISRNCERARVVEASLDRRPLFGRDADVYKPAEDVAEPFDVLLVDGPRGRRRHSRRGALAIVDDALADDFVIVFDDAERRGELDTIAATLKLLDERGTRYATTLVRSVNSQFVIATEGLRAACFF